MHSFTYINQDQNKFLYIHTKWFFIKIDVCSKIIFKRKPINIQNVFSINQSTVSKQIISLLEMV